MNKFDKLDQLSIAYYGKQMYFLEGDGMVFDRQHQERITVDEAIKRFSDELWEACG